MVFKPYLESFLQTAIMIGIACLPTHTKLELKSKYIAHNVRVCKAKTKRTNKIVSFSHILEIVIIWKMCHKPKSNVVANKSN